MTIQIISLVIALFAVIVGPIISYRIAKRNLEFQFRLSVPIKWLDKLEEAAHLFLYSSLEWIEKYPALQDGSSKVEFPNREIDRMLDSLGSSIIKLQLLLDTKKPLQQEILNNVITIKDIINKKTFDGGSISKLRTAHEIIVEKVKTVLQEERSKITKVFR